MPSWSIAIAGAGPAGLAAALLLARDGHRVVLFERFAVPRPLGSGLMLQPAGLAVLSELGLAARILALGRRIDRLFGRVLPSNRIVLDVRYDALGPGRFGLAVHRAALFAPLFETVVHERGRELETGRAVSGLDRDAVGRPCVIGEAGRRFGPFDLVVDATGARSPLAVLFAPVPRRSLAYGALWATLPWPSARFDPHALEQRYRAASIMVGVLPIGRRVESEGEQTAFFWSLKQAQFDAWRAGDLAAWKADVHRLWPETAPLLDAIVDHEQMTFARYAHHTLARPFAERLVAIGDAAHAASPQLGQGANMALLDARALALALREKAEISAALATYAAMRRWHVRFYQALSATFTPFYQSDSAALPRLRDSVVAPATRLPLVRNFIAATVAGLILDPRPRLRLDGAARPQAASSAAAAP
jgi:2-polyprenyl-6-methoxyphenol hydroxylase-like FAD-dependent oxidoreductase